MQLMMTRADSGMGGPHSFPLTKSLGWSWLHEAGCLGHGVRYHLHPSCLAPNVWPPFIWKWTKGFQLQVTLPPHQGLCPWTPLGLRLRILL